MSECIHGLDDRWCGVCKHGPTKPNDKEDEVSECRTCHAAIVWVVTENDKKMPIDAEPSALGRFRKERLEIVDGAERKVVHRLRDAELEANTRPLYQSHYETCPDADQWRRKK